MMDIRLVLIFFILNCLDLYSARQTCPPGTTFFSTQCVRCKDRCLTCIAYDHCTTCKPMYWDNRQYRVCRGNCPTTCANNECDDKTGICKECPKGFYGNSCQISCDICTDGLCDVHKCTNGCKDGFYGVKDFRGIVVCRKCIMGCSKCSNGITCDSCRPGYYPHGTFSCIPCADGCNRCTDRYKCIECVDGKFGVRCDDCAIPHCRNCSSTGSSCQTCQTGFILEDDKCVRCSKSCLGNCDFNAVCLGNCEEGYGGAYCNETCPNYCTACDKNMTALCTQCRGNFYGDRCHLSCSPYCADNKETSPCTHSNGICQYGCINGRYGNRCEYLCPPACTYSYCSQNKGTCVYGCKTGFTGWRCLDKIDTTTPRITARDPSTTPTTLYSTSSSTASTSMSTYVDSPMYPTSSDYIYDYPEPTEAPIIPAGQPPKADDDITPVDTDKAMLPGDSRHNVYVYVGLGIGLCVTMLIIVALAGYIVKRRNAILMNPSNVTPKMSYSHRSDDVNYSDSNKSQNQASEGYLEPSTENTYDYISHDNHQESAPNTATDSNGYLQPSITANRQANPYTSYLTPVNVTDLSTGTPHSSYEPLKFRGITNNLYSGLHKPPDPAYESAF